jgi:hypothetical protein
MNEFGSLNYWIGANDRDVKSGWKWTDGSPFYYWNWNDGNVVILPNRHRIKRTCGQFVYETLCVGLGNFLKENFC